MNYCAFSCVFFILVPCTISLGSCDDISFSICWMARGDLLDRSDTNILLNSTGLKSIKKQGGFTSVTVSPVVENDLTLQYRGKAHKWVFTINSETNAVVRGLKKPQELPSNSTKEILEMFTSSEVFACENHTLFFHQDEHLILAIGQTWRLPIRLEARSSSMLLISWEKNGPASLRPSPAHKVSLYRTELDCYTLSMDTTTTDNHYRFTALEACSPYAACVELPDTHSLTCLLTITDPDDPRHFQVTSWNSSSITVAWDCPENRRHSLFLLTAFYLDASDHVTQELPFWIRGQSLVFTLSDVEPCSRLRFGLQTVCQTGTESRYSKMVLTDGNSVHSNIQSLHQTLFGPNNYTLAWDVRNTSSISMFRVYHEGVLQGTMLTTSHTVGGLQPCRRYQARVEALCGESVLMNAKTIMAHTAQTETTMCHGVLRVRRFSFKSVATPGPSGVSDLKYSPRNSMALWNSSTTSHPAMSFWYELSLENGTTVQSGQLSKPALQLSGLLDGLTYVLDVWEECDEERQANPATICFDGVNRPIQPRILPMELNELEVQFDYLSPTLAIVVPWMLDGPLQDIMSEPRAKMEEYLQRKLEELMIGLHPTVQVQLVFLEPFDGNKTKIFFQLLNTARSGEDVLLPMKEELVYLQTQQSSNITVQDGIIFWNGPDECTSSEGSRCPPSSLCINTLGSYICLCQHGFYDVSSAIFPPVDSPLHPLCYEDGLFSQCLDRLLAGGISKVYLTSELGGLVDVVLNDGRCNVSETKELYFFRMSRTSLQCGTRRLVNQTHTELQNTLTVTLSREQTITRRDLKLVWKCVYPRHYWRHAKLSIDTAPWISSFSLVTLNASLQLGLTMALFSDQTYSYRYHAAISMGPEDTLYFEVALQTRSTFTSDILLQVVSCWATESADPQDEVQGIFLQNGCAVDDTFRWLSANGQEQQSRFSILMFSMPKGFPLYFHCLAHICGPDEDCTMSCTTQQVTKKSVSKRDVSDRQATVVSAGPLLVSAASASGVQTTSWTEHMTMICIVAGLIGLLGITVLGASATKAIMSYYERLRFQ